MFILNIITYRRKEYCERVISNLIGSDEAVWELYKEADEPDKQEGQVSELVKQSKTHKKLTKAQRKEAERLRMLYRRLESIGNLANISKNQILEDLSKQKIKTGFHH